MSRTSRQTCGLALTLAAAATAVMAPASSSAAPTTPAPQTLPAPAPGGVPAAAAQPTADQMNEARRRYDRALELSDEGNYDDALIELQRAYLLAPTYRLLYNLGVVSVAVHDYIKAIDYFSRYLEQGRTEIDAARTSEVQTQISRLRNRIATLNITVNVPGADISLDDTAVGKAPLAKELTVNAGRHRVSANAEGYAPVTQNVEIAGNENKGVSLVLSRQGGAVATERSHPLPWVAYGVTAALGAGTLVTGLLALHAESNYDTTVGTLGSSASQINSDYKKMRGFSIASDTFLGTTVVAAGVSVYLTIKALRHGESPPKVGSTMFLPNGIAF